MIMISQHDSSSVSKLRVYVDFCTTFSFDTTPMGGENFNWNGTDSIWSCASLKKCFRSQKTAELFLEASHTSPRTPFLNDGCFFPSFFSRTSGALTATRRTSSKAARAPGCGGVWRSRTCISSSPIPRPTASSKACYAHHHSFILTAPMSQSSAGRGGEGLTLSTSGTRRSRVRIASLIHRWLP